MVQQLGKLKIANQLKSLEIGLLPKLNLGIICAGHWIEQATAQQSMDWHVAWNKLMCLIGGPNSVLRDCEGFNMFVLKSVFVLNSLLSKKDAYYNCIFWS